MNVVWSECASPDHLTVLSPSCSGKVNQTGVSQVEEEEVVMSSSQQPAKPFKVGGSQVAVATKPAPVSSAGSHISQAVRTQTSGMIFFTVAIVTVCFRLVATELVASVKNVP